MIDERFSYLVSLRMQSPETIVSVDWIRKHGYGVDSIVSTTTAHIFGKAGYDFLLDLFKVSVELYELACKRVLAFGQRRINVYAKTVAMQG